MRHGSSFDGVRLLCSTALVGAALTGGLAQAQTRPGWVDPPDRRPAQAGTEGRAKSVAETPAPAETSPSAETPPSADTPAAARSLARTPPVQAARPERSPMASPRRQVAEPVETRRSAPREGSAERLRIRPRIARTPAMMAPPPVAQSEARFPEWAVAATRLTDAYLDSVSGTGDAMVTAAPRFYAERVQFHGRSLSLAALMAEKRRFARRWPERRYEAQGGATRTACNAATATCIVRTTFDFRADNPGRGARSQGVSELTVTVSFAGPRPLIVGESSRVLRRYGAGPLSAIAGGQHGA